MKPFIFDEQEYHDLSSLGLAFASKFDLALQAIKEKSFVKFFKKFKSFKKQIQFFLYQSRYLQNALSMIIYLVTEEHVFYVGHHRYYAPASILNDMKKNQSFRYFAEDHGFSNTILPTIEDEKLKADLQAFENHFEDEFSLDYFSGYMNKDSIEPISSRVKNISSAKDPFKEAYLAFQSYEVQLSLANRYSLEQVLELRERPCPVFLGFSIVKSDVDLPLSILENAFYHGIPYKAFKYKGIEAKNYRNKLKKQKKSFKKYNKMSDQAKLNYQEKCHLLYLEGIDLYKSEKVLIKESDLEPTSPYCGTYVSSKTVEDLMIIPDLKEKQYAPIWKCEYDLLKFEKSIKNHGYFSFWSLFFLLISSINFIVFGMISSLRDSIYTGLAQMLNKEVKELDVLPSILNPLFFVGAGVCLIITIGILILRSLSKRKYNGLCKLSYYRKNESTLMEKEQKDYEKLKLNEARYARKIDRFYRFYGGIAMAGLSLAISISMICILYTCGFVIQETIPENVLSLLKTKLIFLFIVPGLCLLLGFARHKKTAWSILFTCILSVIAIVCLIFLKF